MDCTKYCMCCARVIEFNCLAEIEESRQSMNNAILTIFSFLLVFMSCQSKIISSSRLRTGLILLVSCDWRTFFIFWSKFCCLWRMKEIPCKLVPVAWLFTLLEKLKVPANFTFNLTDWGEKNCSVGRPKHTYNLAFTQYYCNYLSGMKEIYSSIYFVYSLFFFYSLIILLFYSYLFIIFCFISFCSLLNITIHKYDC